MASLVSRYPVRKLMRNVTLQVEITGSIFGWLEWRRRVAFGLIRLAAWVLGMGIEIKV